MAGKCISCNGSGRIPSHLQPYGFKQSAGMAMDVCNRCNGSGRGEGGDESAPRREKTLPVVWFFGLVAAFFAAILKPLPTDWFLNGFAAFVVFGMLAGFTWQRVPYGRVILAILGLLIVAFLGFAIFRAETGQAG